MNVLQKFCGHVVSPSLMKPTELDPCREEIGLEDKYQASVNFILSSLNPGYHYI